MGKKRDIIILIVCGVVFFSVYSLSYYVRNYSAIEPDASILRSQTSGVSSTASASTGTYPSKTKVSSAEKGTIDTTVTVPTAAPICININTASKEELMLLHGIGDVLSTAIINYRETNGRFNNIDELLLVDGIGEGILSDIRSYIYVEDPCYPASENEYVPSPEEEPEPEEIPVQDETDTDAPVMVDINTADAEQLMSLPHIDEEKAQRIIELRDKIGGFSSYYELLLVDGLTQAQVSEIKEQIAPIQ